MTGTGPRIGLGVWQIEGDRAVGVIRDGLDLGYRVIDTASAYGNETAVGAAIAASPVDREEVRVITKIWLTDFGRVDGALDESRRRLGLDTIDLVLLHWPVPSDFDRTIRAFDALLTATADGRVRQAGVSNFLPEHLVRLRTAAGVVPAVNQVEAHPYYSREELRRLHADAGVETQAHSPFGGQRARAARPIDDPLVAAVAAEVGATPGQTVLAWHRQHGVMPLPRASSAGRLAENLRSAEVTLSAAQMARIDRLDRGLRLGPDPREVHDLSFA